jgi:hypothetical protein
MDIHQAVMEVVAAQALPSTLGIRCYAITVSNTSNLDHGTLEDADLDAVSGGSAVWMACYLTAQHLIGKLQDAEARALLYPPP